MPVANARIVDEFWEVCNAAFETWAARREVFEDNPDLARLQLSHCAPYLHHLNEITHQQVVHRIAKLHDPETTFGHANLSIAFVINVGAWDRFTAMRISQLKADLDKFATLLRTARNKLLAHNDLATIMAADPVGMFPLDADIDYFKHLQEFMDVVAGGPKPFNDLVRNDAKAFVESLLRGAILPT